MKKKQLFNKDAFTLIEVIVSVMIISIVIMALLEMKSNNSFMLTSLKKQSDNEQYISLLITNKDYGFEDKKIRLDALVKEFDVDDKLRKKLKNIKANIIYKEISIIDLNEEDNSSSSMIIEIGESSLKMDNASAKIYRLKMND